MYMPSMLYVCILIRYTRYPVLQAAYELGLFEKYVEAAALFEEVRSAG